MPPEFTPIQQSHSYKVLEQGHANLIEDLVATVGKYSDIPEAFVRAAAYIIVSCVLGKYLYIADIPGRTKGANCFFFLGGTAGVAHKSTLEDLVIRILFEFYIKTNWNSFTVAKKSKKDRKGQVVEGEYEYSLELAEEDEPENDTMKRQLLEQRFKDHIIENSNVEGIIDHMESTNLDFYLVIGSEHGESLTKIQSQKSYEFGLLTILSKLYYGESYKFNLSQRGGKVGQRYLRSGTFTNLFLGCQDLRKVINETVLGQGLIRRGNLLQIYLKDLDPNNYKPAVSENWKVFYEIELPKFVEKLLEYENILLKYRRYEARIPVNVMAIDLEINESGETSRRKAIEYAKKRWSESGVIADGQGAFISSDWERKIRLSTLYAAAELNMKLIDDEAQLEVTPQHLGATKKFLSSFKENEDFVLNHATNGDPSMPVDLSYAGKKEEVLDAIRIRGGMCPAPVIEKMRGKWENGDDILRDLRREGRIRGPFRDPKEIPNPKGGRPRLYFFTNADN